jgi:hypothetical protein
MSGLRSDPSCASSLFQPFPLLIIPQLSCRIHVRLKYDGLFGPGVCALTSGTQTPTSGWVVAPGIFLGVLDDDIGANLGKSYGRLGCSDTSFCESQRFARLIPCHALATLSIRIFADAMVNMRRFMSEW